MTLKTENKILFAISMITCVVCIAFIIIAIKTMDNETLKFGIAFVAMVLTTVFLYLCLCVFERITKNLFMHKYKKESAHKQCWVSDDEFYEIGAKALREKRMQSFITETSQDKYWQIDREGASVGIFADGDV